MDITPHLPHVRDYVGATPDDTTLYTLAVDATYWQEVALRVLRRRRADATAGGQQPKTFSLDGVLSVGLSTTDIKALDATITDLEAQLAARTATTPTQVGRITRPDRYR